MTVISTGTVTVPPGLACSSGMKIVGSGPPLGAAGRPVGRAGMFGTFTRPMTR